MTRLLTISAGVGAVVAIIGALTIPEEPACILLADFDCPSPTPLPEMVRNSAAAVLVVSLAGLALRHVVAARARVTPESRRHVVEERSYKPAEDQGPASDQSLGAAGSERDARLGDLVLGLLLAAAGLFFFFIDRVTATLVTQEIDPPPWRVVIAVAGSLSLFVAGTCRVGFAGDRETCGKWTLRFAGLGSAFFLAWAATGGLDVD